MKNSGDINLLNNVSFFIPAYNCVNTLAESIDSILLTNFEEGDELIIVNDCSVDGTQKILEEYSNRYSFIKIIHHTRNKGGGATRNTAIDSCIHNLLFCLDSDNVLEKNSIRPLKQYLLSNKAEVVSFQHLKYFSKSIDEIDYTWTLGAGLFNNSEALSSDLTPGAGGNYLFTKTSWLNAGGYPEFAGALDTWGFGIRQLLTGSRVMVLENSYYYHRLSPNSYFIRDVWNKRNSISIRATQILIPFFDLISDEDLNYILSKKHRYNWQENMSKRPIKILESVKTNAIFSEKENNNHKNFSQLIAKTLDKFKSILS